MNRINFNGKNGGIFHHFTPYRKKPIQKIVKNEIEKPIYNDTVNIEVLNNIPFFRNVYRTVDMVPVTNSCKEIPLKKTVKSNVMVINNPNDYKHKNGFRVHHSHQSFIINDQSLSVSDSIGGCGMQQFYAWTGILNEDNAYTLIDYYIKNRNNSVGLVICQLGQDYFNHHFERALIKHNFKILSEYKNFTHGSDGRYKQRIYGLELELTSIKRNERDD